VAHAHVEAAWTTVLSKCNETQELGKNMLYFGMSNQIGPGSVWRRETDGSIRLRLALTDLEPDEKKRSAIVQRNNTAACSGSNSTSWSLHAGLPFSGLAAPVSGDVTEDLRRADTVTVTINGWGMDVLKETLFEKLVSTLQEPAFQREFASGELLIAENVVRVDGMTAAFSFSRKADLNLDKLKTQIANTSVQLGSGAHLRTSWVSDTTLAMSTDEPFYLIAAFGTLNNGRFGAVAAEGANRGRPVPDVVNLRPVSEREQTLAPLQRDLQARKAAVEALKKAKVETAKLDILVHDGSALLTGEMPSSDMAAQAEREVRSVPGITTVASRVTVAPVVVFAGPVRQSQRTQVPGCSCGPSDVIITPRTDTIIAGGGAWFQYDGTPICNGQAISSPASRVHWGPSGETEALPDFYGTVRHVFNDPGPQKVVVTASGTCFDVGAQHCANACTARGEISVQVQAK
jgi:BON domain